MSTFTEIKTNIRTNLADAGITSYAAADLDYSVQDAYDDIAFRTGCIIKKSTSTAWTANLNYYDFRSTFTDFMSCLAIFNDSNNRWLEDNVTLRQMRMIRSNWEMWLGQPNWWIPISPKYVAICPKLDSVGSTDKYTLFYAASAPTVVDGDTPLIVTDMQDLLEFYSTADLLEQFEEFTKASEMWKIYFSRSDEYKERVKNIAKADLLVLIN